MQNRMVPKDHAGQLRRPRVLAPAVGVSSPEVSRQRAGRACEVQLQSRCSCISHRLGNSWLRGLQSDHLSEAARNSGQVLGGGLPLGNCIRYRKGVPLTRQGRINPALFFSLASLLFTIFIGIFVSKVVIRIRTTHLLHLQSHMIILFYIVPKSFQSTSAMV